MTRALTFSGGFSWRMRWQQIVKSSGGATRARRVRAKVPTHERLYPALALAKRRAQLAGASRASGKGPILSPPPKPRSPVVVVTRLIQPLAKTPPSQKRSGRRRAAKSSTRSVVMHPILFRYQVARRRTKTTTAHQPRKPAPSIGRAQPPPSPLLLPPR